MFALGLVSLWARWRKTLYTSRFLHRFALLMSPAGFVAVIAGWVTTEVGRQPYVIYGLMRTADAASPLDAPAVAASLLAFVVPARALGAATHDPAGRMGVEHLTPGTSAVDAGDLWALATGSGDQGVRDILWASRLPRLLAAVVVGVALGAAGAVLQSVARNPLASPDTLAVTNGAFLAVKLGPVGIPVDEKRRKEGCGRDRYEREPKKQ